jgi:ornithine cyclodeaminase/alanine dehydrogenase-like protein (mu-crystallin family)
VDEIAAARKKAGDLLIPLAAGDRSFSPLSAELGAVAARSVGRASEEEITLFRSCGMAIQDVAGGIAALEVARERDLSTLLHLSDG